MQVRGSESVVQLGAPAGVPEGPPVRGISRSLGHLRPHVLQVMSNSVVHMDVVVSRGLFRSMCVDTGVGFGQEADRQAQAISWELYSRCRLSFGIGSSRVKIVFFKAMPLCKRR